jgi:hypothetical protein
MLKYQENLSFVPAESAEIGITDKILTRIATRDSVSKVRDESCSAVLITHGSADSKYLYGRSTTNFFSFNPRY